MRMRGRHHRSRQPQLTPRLCLPVLPSSSYLQIPTLELNFCLTLLFFTLAGEPSQRCCCSPGCPGRPLPPPPLPPHMHEGPLLASPLPSIPFAVLFWLLAAGAESVFWQRFGGWWGLFVAGERRAARVPARERAALTAALSACSPSSTDCMLGSQLMLVLRRRGLVHRRGRHDQRAVQAHRTAPGASS